MRDSETAFRSEAADSNLRAVSVTSMVLGGSGNCRIAALVGRGIAEMAQQDRAAAGRGFDEPASAFSARAPAGGGRVRPRSRSAGGLGRVFGSPEQPRLGRLAVAAGAAGFLVIGLDRLGDSGMGDEAHVGLVDAHAEGDGRRHTMSRIARTRPGWGRGPAARGRRDRAVPLAPSR